MHLAALAEASADFARARGLLEEALLVARPTGDRFLIAEALLQLARRDIIVADFGPPARSLEEGLALATAVGSPELVVRLRLQLGVVVRRLEDVARGRAPVPRRARPGPAGSGTAQTPGTPCSDSGGGGPRPGRRDVAEARPSDAVLALFQGLGGGTGGRWGTAWPSRGWSTWPGSGAIYPPGATSCGSCSVTWRDAGDRLGVAGCLQELAGVAVAPAHAPAALRLLGAADAIRRAGRRGRSGTGPRAGGHPGGGPRPPGRPDRRRRLGHRAGHGDRRRDRRSALPCRRPGRDGERPANPPPG